MEDGEGGIGDSREWRMGKGGIVGSGGWGGGRGDGREWRMRRGERG